MAISINFATKVILINQADLTLISGSLFELPTEDTFRFQVNSLLDSEEGIVFDDAIRHNTSVTVAGTTFARTIEIINGYSVTFENLLYSVRLAQSNNNLFDVESSILNPSGNVTVIGQNSAGLIETAVSGLTAPESIELKDIHDAHFNRRKLDIPAKTETLFEDDKTTPKKVFDTNPDVAITGITELTPQ